MNQSAYHFIAVDLKEEPKPPKFSVKFRPIIRKGRIRGVRKGTLEVVFDGRGEMQVLPVERRP